jgi:PKD repeat protein
MARRRTVLVGVLLVVVGLLGVATVMPAIAAGLPARAGGLATSELVGARQLALAAASLRSAVGPAAGTPLGCTAVGVGSEDCAARTSAASNPPGVAGYTWANVTSLVSVGPSGRLASMAWDASDGYVLLFGGESSAAFALADTWTYLNGTWTNVTARVSGAPPALVAESLAFDPSSGKVVLFGGINESGVYQDLTWAYHAMAWANLTATAGTPPSPRAFPGLSTDTTDGQVVLFGGRLNVLQVWVGDTWTFKNGAWKNVTSVQSFPLPAIYDGPILLDDPGHGVFLFGLAEWGARFHPGTYVFSGGLWENLTPTLGVQPPGFLYGAGAYVPSLSGFLVFSSGILNSSANYAPSYQTWEFSGGAWTNVTALAGTAGQQPGYAGGTAFDPLDQAVLTFGGEDFAGPTVNPYTCSLSAPPAVSAHASLGVADAGLNVTFTGAASGGLSPTSVAWTYGDGNSATTLTGKHAYTHGGLYDANFTATSLAGANATASLAVFVNAAPSVAVATVPANATAGSAIGFVPTLAGGTGPFTFAWSFGDGGTSAAAAPSHAYAAAGTYPLHLTVTDSLGVTASATASVTVLAAPAPGSSSSGSVSLTSGVGLYLLLGLLAMAAIAVVLGVLLARRPRPPRAPPTAYAPSGVAPPPEAPPSGSVPPPGAS